MVVRFNGGAVGKRWGMHVGDRTDMRVLNHLNSRLACCKSTPVVPEAGRMRNMTLMLWYALSSHWGCVGGTPTVSCAEPSLTLSMNPLAGSPGLSAS